MSALMTFMEWQEIYNKFKKKLEPIVSSDLPNETVSLEAENQALPPLYSAACQHEAMAAFFYEQAKERRKPLSQYTWAKKDTAGVAANLKARSYAVSAALRRGL